MYSVQNSPSKEILVLYIVQFYFKITARVYEDAGLYCSIQYSLLTDMTTFLSHIAEILGCVLCKCVRAHGDGLNSISETSYFFGTLFYGIRKFVTLFTRACH
jgi:hypothetical protein